MGTLANVPACRRGVCCGRCGSFLREPQWSDYFREEGVVLDLWACTQCGHRFETEARVGNAGRPNSADSLPKEISPPLWRAPAARADRSAPDYERAS